MKNHGTFENNEAAHSEPESTDAKSGLTVRRTQLHSNCPVMGKRARDDWQELAASLKK